MTDKLKIGFVGAGLMGHGMAKHVLAAGYPLTVIANTNRKPIDSLVSLGASEAHSLAELAQASEVIILCLSNSQIVEEVILGEAGLLNNANAGTIIIDATTSYPDSTKMLNEKVRAKDCLFADAPMSRSPQKAEEGQLVAYTSCEQELFATIKPIMESYCEYVIYLGDRVGMAHEVKLMNNFIAVSYISTWAEAYNTCIAKGIDPKGLHEVVSSAGLNCLNFQNYSKFVLDGNQNGHKFSVANTHKDIDYYVKMAAAAGIRTEMAQPALALFAEAVERGYGKDYGPVMPKVVGEINDTPAKELPRGTPE